MPSSIVTIGYCAHQLARKSTNCSRGQALALAGQVVLAVLEELAGGHVQAEQHVLAGLVAGLADRLEDGFQRFLVAAQVGREAALVADRGGQAARPSAPTSARGRSRCRRAALRRSESKPTGSTMNSCRSTLLSACAPPLMMFIIGTGSDTARRRSAQVLPQRHACATRPPRARPPSTRRAARSRRAGPCSRCRRGRSGAGPGPAWSAASKPCSASAIAPLTLPTALRTPLPR